MQKYVFQKYKAFGTFGISRIRESSQNATHRMASRPSSQTSEARIERIVTDSRNYWNLIPGTSKPFCPFFFCSVLPKGPGRFALQSAYYDPPLDENKLKQQIKNRFVQAKTCFFFLLLCCAHRDDSGSRDPRNPILGNWRGRLGTLRGKKRTNPTQKQPTKANKQTTTKANKNTKDHQRVPSKKVRRVGSNADKLQKSKTPALSSSPWWCRLRCNQSSSGHAWHTAQFVA